MKHDPDASKKQRAVARGWRQKRLRFAGSLPGKDAKPVTGTIFINFAANFVRRSTQDALHQLDGRAACNVKERRFYRPRRIRIVQARGETFECFLRAVGGNSKMLEKFQEVCQILIKIGKCVRFAGDNAFIANCF